MLILLAGISPACLSQIFLFCPCMMLVGEMVYCIIFPVYSKMENTGNIVVGMGLGVGVGMGVGC